MIKKEKDKYNFHRKYNKKVEKLNTLNTPGVCWSSKYFLTLIGIDILLGLPSLTISTSTANLLLVKVLFVSKFTIVKSICVEFSE